MATAIGTVALDVNRIEGTAAVNSDELTNVVVSAVVFHKMVDPAMKPEPFTSNVKPVLPAVTFVGKIAETAGGVFTVIEAAAEVPPPGLGLLAITERLPAVARSLTVNEALTCVALI